ncbi:unnamed protein product [Polarella glacialis]|nr:unnamed protein product [Polarella glacialis]
MRSGGTVQEAADGPARIHGVAVSRAFGTYLSPFGRKELKDPSLPHADRLVSCVPEIYCWSVQPGDVLVLACDGVWDVVETSEVVSFEGDVRERVRGICSRALKTSTDNVTCIVAQLGAPMPEPEQTEPSQLDIMAAARADRPGFNRVSRAEQLEIGHELDYGEVLIKMMQGHETNLVSKNLWLGTAGDACHLPFLEFAQVTKVVNCAAEIERPDIPGVDSFWLKWCDSEEQGKAEQKSGFKRLRAATQFIQSTLESDRAVLVHCVQGVSRSACVVVALLMEWRCMEMDEAVAKVRQNHPGALKPFRFQEMLRAFQHFLRTQ